MWKALLVVPLVLMLSNCAALRGEAPECQAGATPAQQTACFIRKVQEGSRAICGVLPTVATITGLLGVGIPGVAEAVQVVCAAVAAAPPLPPPATGLSRVRKAAPVTVGNYKGVSIQVTR